MLLAVRTCPGVSDVLPASLPALQAACAAAVTLHLAGWWLWLAALLHCLCSKGAVWAADGAERLASEADAAVGQSQERPAEHVAAWHAAWCASAPAVHCAHAVLMLGKCRDLQAVLCACRAATWLQDTSSQQPRIGWHSQQCSRRGDCRASAWQPSRHAEAVSSSAKTAK